MNNEGNSTKIDNEIIDDTDNDNENLAITAFTNFFNICTAIIWLIMTALIVPFGVIMIRYILLEPIRWVSYKWFNYLEHRVCHLVNDHWVATASYAGLNVIEYGDDLSKIQDERALFLPNHLGLIDHFILMTAFYQKSKLAGRYIWVIFNIWKWTPLGFMWMAHGNFFINGGAKRRERVLNDFRKHLNSLYWTNDLGYIVMYPEGSRFYLIKESGAKFSLQNNLKHLKHCAYPRIGAAKAILDVVGPKNIKENEKDKKGFIKKPLKYIVDCTLGYHKGEVPDLRDVLLQEWPNNNSTVGIHYKIYEVTSEMCDEKYLQEFLYKCYVEKDKLLEYYYKYDAFPNSKPRLVHFPWTRMIFVESFWLTFFFASIYLIVKPTIIFLYQTVISLF
uniref:PlsC domain-containing protein n=1 Tax=Parastrongyloides trichosuri TaxID=131310 RepID=A0A0N4ZPD4_PARTI